MCWARGWGLGKWLLFLILGLENELGAGLHLDREKGLDRNEAMLVAV